MKTHNSKKIAVALLAALAAPVGTLAAPGEVVYDIVAGWTIRTDLNQDYACYAETTYEGQTILRVGYDAGRKLFVRVGDPEWASLEAEQSYGVELDFGDESTWSEQASGYAFNTDAGQPGLIFEIDAEKARPFLRAFREQVAVDVTLEGRQPISLSLAGSYRAGARLEDCQVEMAAARARSSSDDTTETARNSE
jgi:hypothetical protein